MCKKHWTRVRRAELAGAPIYRGPIPEPVHYEPPPPDPVVVILSAGAEPAVCERCGRPYAADRTIRPELLNAAAANHARYCPGPAA